MIFKYSIIFVLLCNVCFRLSLADDENLQLTENLSNNNDNQIQTETAINKKEIDEERENDNEGSLFNKLFLSMIEKNKLNQKSSNEQVKKLSFSQPSQYLPQYGDQTAGQAVTPINSIPPSGAGIQIISNQQPSYQYQQTPQSQQSPQSQQQVYVDPTTGQIIDPNSWMVAQQNALFAQQQQQQQQQQSQLTQRMMMTKKNSEYFGSEAYKNRRMNNTLREQRLKLLNDDEFLQNHHKIGQFIIAKNLENPEIYATTPMNNLLDFNENRIRNNPAYAGGYMNVNKNADKNKFKQYYNNFLNLNDEKVKTNSAIQSKNFKLKNYEKLDFSSAQENDPINRKSGRYMPKFQIVMDDETDEGIQMNSVNFKKTYTTTLPNCVDTTTTKSANIVASTEATATTTTTTTTSTTTRESTTYSSTTEASTSKSARQYRRKNKAYNLANTGRPAVQNSEQDDDEDQFLTLSKKFDLKEKQYKDFLLKQQSKGTLDQQHRQNYDALMDHEKVMKLSQNNKQPESDEINKNNQENLIKLSAYSDIDELIEQVDSSRNENSEELNIYDESAPEFHPSETVEQLNQEEINQMDSNREREQVHKNNNNARRERIKHIKNLNRKKTSNSGIKTLSLKRPKANLYMEDYDFNPRYRVPPSRYHNAYLQDMDQNDLEDTDY